MSDAALHERVSSLLSWSDAKKSLDEFPATSMSFKRSEVLERLNIDQKAYEEDYKKEDKKLVYGRWVVYQDGQFLRSGATYEEAVGTLRGVFFVTQVGLTL